MAFRSKQQFPPRLLMKARRYVEEQRIPFFDFFRHCTFGFVQTGDNKGYFVLLIQNPDDTLESICNCSTPSEVDVCSHGLALYLRLIGWPNQRHHLSKAFEAHPLRTFLQNLARKVTETDLRQTQNPQVTFPGETLPQRLVDYLGFGEEGTPLVKRDRKCLMTAKNRARSNNERVMLQQNMPSVRMFFEESPLYGLSKMLFYLELKGELRHFARQLPDHQVEVVIQQADLEILKWSLDIATFLKATKNQWPFWESTLDFEVRRQGVSLLYRITFAEGNALEIEAVIPVGNGEYVLQEEVSVPGAGNLCYHANLGYFHIQTGLSPFEMQYSESGIHRIAPDEVKQFLKAHRDTLENLDRELMAEGLFEQLVTQHFNSFELSLLDYLEGEFQIRVQASLGGLDFRLQGLRDLLSQPTRYAKAGGKLFDTLGYDALSLKPILEDLGEPPTLSVVKVFQFIAFFRERLKVNTTALTAPVYEAMRGEALPEPPDLDHTNLDLRHYQHLGYQWLHFLRTYGLGGLLCDQMGLGKTHQGMSLIAATLADKQDANVLVIAPTSVLFHWRQKLRDFCPDLKTNLHHGPQRSSIAGISKGHVFITSYGTARNDADQFAERLWDLIIFDEVHILKNKNTKAYRAIQKLKCLCRIGLTGTPLENHIGELKSLMDLVMPGYMGADPIFKRFFTDPILKFNHGPTKKRLKKMVSPFILRRAKSQVLTELPDKVEDLRDYELAEYERDLYEQIKTKGKAELEEDATAGPPRMMHIFQIINKLKQVCNHPALYFGNNDYKAYPSSKWDMFTELIAEAMASDEKLVVFTQYLGMVSLIRSYLHHENILHACVTGSTRNREAEQKRFQDDPQCKVFVGTLQAAGVGIDLTSGSVLVHYDRWWNPAREEQATDRIHRIGQKRNVQIYKFRALNSVEARIDRIIERKRGLLKDLVDFDNEQASKSFSVDELLEILA